MVRYLKPSKRKPIASLECPFQLYDWEYHPIRRGHPQPTVFIEMINVNSIVSQAFIIPYFSIHRSLPDYNKPRQDDTFWYMDIKFCDRAGWNDINVPGNDSLYDNLEVDLNINDYDIDNSDDNNSNKSSSTDNNSNNSENDNDNSS